MKLRISDPARRLTRLLLKERISLYLEARRNGLSESILQETFAHEVRFFQRVEAKIPGKPGPVLLQRLFENLSPYYGKIFSLAKNFKIEIRPVLQSHSRQLIEWNPFSNEIAAPPIREEIDFLLKQPLDRFTATDTFDMLGLNANVMHDVLHGVFQRLIPPPRDTKNLRDYYLFIEALVFTSERYACIQFGEVLTDAFTRLRFLSLNYLNDPVIAATGGEAEKVFTVTLANLLAGMHDWPKEQRQKKLPAHAPFAQSSHLEISPVFLKRFTPAWLRAVKKLSYPERWRKARLKERRLFLESFAIADLLKKDQLAEIYRWHCELFNINPRTKIEISK